MAALPTHRAARAIAGKVAFGALALIASVPAAPDTGDAPVRLFVRLATPATGEVRAARAARGASVPDAAEQKAYSARVSREQDAVSQRIAPLVRRELSRLRVAANGIMVSAPHSAVDALRKIDGVLDVTPVAHADADNAASVAWVQAPEVWQAVGDGTGLTIAVIDTGIDYLHANFGGTGDPQAYADNDKNLIEAGTFPTAKVVGGWDFAGPTYNSREDEFPAPDPDPLDGNGHGSHVAGTAAGVGVPGRIGPGVAKGARLLALKVFSDESGSTDLTADAIEMALDPNGDGAIDDRVDVINMSLGARYGDPGDPSALASATAAQNGVIVVASAGNNGDKAYVTGSPAVSPPVISVAATIAGGRPQIALRVMADDPQVAGLYAAQEGAGPVAIVDAPVTAALVRAHSASIDADGNVLPGQFDDGACRHLLNHAAVRGKVVLAARTGGCSHEIKYANAQRAGAAGILVYNDTAANRPLVMGGIGLSGKTFTIPGMMISGTDGALLKAALKTTALRVEFATGNTVPPPPELADQLTFFTSRGPAHGGAGFKPDLAAPGRFTMSTAAGTGFKGRQLRGTSMAAPHVAGAAALLRQRHPDLAVAGIKALLQNATVDSTFDGPGTDTVAPLSLQGVGVLRVADAVALDSYVAPAGVSFGYLNPLTGTTRTVSTELVNLTANDRVYNVSHRARGSVPGVQVACPDTVSVSAGGRTRFDIAMAVDDPARVPWDSGRLSHQDFDGWCVLDDGVDTLRVGYVGGIDAASRVQAASGGGTVAMTNDGPANGRASGYRLIGTGGTREATRPIAAVGYREANVFGFAVFQLALALDAPWESPAHVSVQMFIDAGRDGRYERVLFAGDWSLLGFDPGTYVTGVFHVLDNARPDFDSGYVDWFSEDVDFNDQVMSLPYSLLPDVGLTFLKPDQRSFDYKLIVTSRDGSYDVQTGFVDLDAGRVTDEAEVLVQAGANAELNLLNDVPGLWLLPNNAAGEQYSLPGERRK